MVNWHDPVNINLDNFGVTKVIYFVLGIFTWEVLSTLYFDWQVITGKRVFKWPYLLYVACRVCMTFTLVSSSMGSDITIRFDCQVWYLLGYISGYLGAALGSALLVLQTIAFWNNKKIILGLAVSIWMLNLSFLIYATTQIHSRWETEQNACLQLDTSVNFKIILVALCADLALLTIMLSRIWHNRKEGNLWNLVYRQGILWVAGATAGELPGIILISFNFNSAINQLLVPFASLATALCATGMYRELCEYANPVTGTQYSSIDISPMKFKSSSSTQASRPTMSIDLQVVAGSFDEGQPWT